MPDTYLDLVNRDPGRAVAKRLGLPRPAVLRRYSPGEPLLDGPLLLLGAGSDADALAAVLAGPAGGPAVVRPMPEVRRAFAGPATGGPDTSEAPPPQPVLHEPAASAWTAPLLVRTPLTGSK